MDPSTEPPVALVVVGPDEGGAVDLDTGAAGRDEVAARVAVARIGGARAVRTAEARAARRAAHVVDALVATRRAEAGG